MMKKSKSFRNHKNKLIFRGGSSKLSFASFVQEGSSIMGGSSNIGGSSNVSGALRNRQVLTRNSQGFVYFLQNLFLLDGT
jgi:hypothetical protein